MSPRRSYRCDPDALTTWIEAQTRSNTSDPGPVAT